MDVKSSIRLFICRANSFNIGVWWFTLLNIWENTIILKLLRGTQASVFISNVPKTKASGKSVLSQLSHNPLFSVCWCFHRLSWYFYMMYVKPNMSQRDTSLRSRRTCMHTFLKCVYTCFKLNINTVLRCAFSLNVKFGEALPLSDGMCFSHSSYLSHSNYGRTTWR